MIMNEVLAGRKRFRACEACHVLKIRCETGIARLDSCEHCWRAGQTCVPAARRRQKDRIAELESLVSQLQIALQKKNHDIGRHNVFSNLEDARSKADETPQYLAFLDARVSRQLQQEAVDVYSCKTVPLLPVVPISGLAFTQLRAESPILLLSIVAFATSGVIEAGVQDQLVEMLMQVFGMELIGAGTKTLEYVQALLIGAFWFRARPGLKHATFYQLFQLARGIAIDLGIGGPDLQSIPGGCDGTLENPCSITARRTWLSCFLATCATSLSMRQGDSNLWTPYHEDCLQHLELSSDYTTSDRTLCQIVRVLRLCQRIANRTGLFESMSTWDITDPSMSQATSQLHVEIEEWCAQIPSALLVPNILFWKHIAIIYLYEPVLHNKSNKKTFSIPFPPAKIAASEFAAPMVSTNHTAALYILKDACQKALDLYIDMGPTLVLALSPMLVTPTIRYALFILAKIYVAVTAPGNTYGQVLVKDELKFEHYIEKVKSLGESMMAIDQTSFNARIISASSTFEDWLSGYSAFVSQYESTNVAIPEVELFTDLDFRLSESTQH